METKTNQTQVIFTVNILIFLYKYCNEVLQPNLYYFFKSFNGVNYVFRPKRFIDDAALILHHYHVYVDGHDLSTVKIDTLVNVSDELIERFMYRCTTLFDDTDNNIIKDKQISLMLSFVFNSMAKTIDETTK